MLMKLLIAFCLMALSVAVHAGVVAAALSWHHRRMDKPLHFWPATWLLIRLMAWVVLAHLAEIGLWGATYWGGHAMPDAETAFYFSAVTYTTTGYGDFVLPESWRLVGGVEALTGILMCGWSAAFFFAIVSRMYHASTRHTA